MTNSGCESESVAVTSPLTVRVAVSSMVGRARILHCT
jgi:hypothetical protein